MDKQEIEARDENRGKYRYNIFAPDGETELFIIMSIVPIPHLTQGEIINTKGYLHQNDKPEMKVKVDRIEYEIGIDEDKEEGILYICTFRSNRTVKRSMPHSGRGNRQVRIL